MIKLNDNKTKSNLLKLINREISFIDTSLAYQRSLNKEVLLCMNLITQNSEVIETAMEFSKNYEALNNVMALLKKSTFNIDTLEALLSQLYEIKNNENILLRGSGIYYYFLSQRIHDENTREDITTKEMIYEWLNNNRPVRQAFSFKINKNMVLLY